MGQRDSNAGEERLLPRRGPAMRSFVSTNNQRATVGEEQGASDTPAVPVAASPAYELESYELNLDKRWPIDPNLLFVGSKIGEGAHGKVY
eukprot:c17029_g1_i1 orf=1-267(-)